MRSAATHSRSSGRRGISIALFGLAPLVVAGYLCADQAWLRVAGVRAEATFDDVIVEKEVFERTRSSRGGVRIWHYLRYRFVTDSGREVVTTSQVAKWLADSSPETIEVVYDPADPIRNYVVEDTHRWALPAAVALLGLLVFTGFGPVLAPKFFGGRLWCLFAGIGVPGFFLVLALESSWTSGLWSIAALVALALTLLVGVLVLFGVDGRGGGTSRKAASFDLYSLPGFVSEQLRRGDEADLDEFRASMRLRGVSDEELEEYLHSLRKPL